MDYDELIILRKHDNFDNKNGGQMEKENKYMIFIGFYIFRTHKYRGLSALTSDPEYLVKCGPPSFCYLFFLFLPNFFLLIIFHLFLSALLLLFSFKGKEIDNFFPLFR